MKVRISLVSKSKTLTPAEHRQRVEAARSPRRRKYGVGTVVYHKQYGEGTITHATDVDEGGKPVYSIQYKNPVQMLLGPEPFVAEEDLKPMTHGQRLGSNIRAYHEKKRREQSKK